MIRNKHNILHFAVKILIDSQNPSSYTPTIEKKLFINWLRKVMFSENDVMANYRNRIMIPVGMTALVLLTIFSVNNLLQGRFENGLVILFAQAVLLVVVLALRRGKPSPVPFGVVVLLLFVGVFVAVVRQGILGALWSYPGAYLLLRAVATPGVTAQSGHSCHDDTVCGVLGQF